MQDSLLTRFEKYLKEHSLVRRGDDIIVAVSGGVDSIALLDLLTKLERKYALRVKVAHYNHQLRGKESEQDETFVRKLAKKYKLPVVVERSDTASYAEELGASIQEAARELRYRFLTKLARGKGWWKIATAHNANDNAETLLLNLCRGAGLSGLTGIPPLRPDINAIRPLLFATRREIEAYAKSHGLRYRTDSSNKKLYYKRNFIRLNVLPILQEHLNPEIVRSLNRTSEILRRAHDLIHREAEGLLKKLTVGDKSGRVLLKLQKFQELHPFLQETIVEILAQRFTGSPIESEKVSRILALLRSQVGKRVEVSGKLLVYREREHLVFSRREEKGNPEIEVKPNKSYILGKLGFKSKVVPRTSVRWPKDRSVEYVDADRLNSRLVLRPWREGDWFMPLGMRGRKKLSDFLVDEKIPLYEKKSIPVLESHGNIVWVCGVRLDNRFRLTESTKRVLRLEIEKKEA